MICGICGKEFDALDGRYKYCGEACSKVARYESLKKWELENPEKVEARKKKYLNKKKGLDL